MEYFQCHENEKDPSFFDEVEKSLPENERREKFPPYVNGWCKTHKKYEDCGCPDFMLHCDIHYLYYSPSKRGCEACERHNGNTLEWAIRHEIARLTKFPATSIICDDMNFYFDHIDKNLHIITKEVYIHDPDQIPTIILKRGKEIHQRMMIPFDFDDILGTFEDTLTIDGFENFPEEIDTSDILPSITLTSSDPIPIASSSSQIGTVVTDCPLCLNKYDNGQRTPKILKCGHSFCVTCIVPMIFPDTNSKKNFSVICPFCRKLSGIDRTEELITDFSLMAI